MEMTFGPKEVITAHKSSDRFSICDLMINIYCIMLYIYIHICSRREREI